MTAKDHGQLTELLAAAGNGDKAASGRVWTLVYDQLRSLAQHQLANEHKGHRRHPTSLVHEAYFRLTAGEDVQWANRRHFFAAAARAMRRIRIDDARKRGRLKRGGGGNPVPLNDDAAVLQEDPALVLAVDEALDKLEQEDPRKAEVVMLRYFAGLSVEECAQAVGLSVRTVGSEWRFARAWLHAELSKGETNA